MTTSILKRGLIAFACVSAGYAITLLETSLFGIALGLFFLAIFNECSDLERRIGDLEAKIASIENKD